jgi:hypothetical protein
VDSEEAAFISGDEKVVTFVTQGYPSFFHSNY